ncbi:DNA cytosine methyltransferase [Isoptericola sp. NPDC060257]|uniref:DNA cytosine methyltransferase n=1 Tax=Isoptericola sp. NPDC060257 TaxID=3347087 RepID=UPI0036536F91
MSNQLNSVEIFAGGGGMALGMRRAGFTHEALVEWWAPAAKVLRHNAERDSTLWTKEHVFEKDVRKTTDELAELGPINLVAGGPPCQPFSLAGTGAGHSDDRNMFPAALDIVRQLMPDYVVFENVPGLTRPSFAPYLDYVKDQLRRPTITPKDGELWNEHHARVRASELQELYCVYQEEIDAADVGVAQSRKRIFLVAVRGDLKNAGSWQGITRTHSRDVLLHQQWITGTYWNRHGLVKPEIVPARLNAQIERIKKTGAPDNRLPWKTLRDLLADVPEPAVEIAPDGWPNHIAIPGARTYAKHTGSPLDMPSKTIKAGVHGVAGGEAMLRELDGAVRYLSIREAALVQGFPQDYEFPGVRSRVMGVIGNAVAVDVAAHVGRTLIALRAEQEERTDDSVDTTEVIGDLDTEARIPSRRAAAIA